MKTLPFDPMLKTIGVPQTDDEAREALREDKHPPVAACLVGIFDVRRMQGDALLVAYEVVLKTYLEAAGYKFSAEGMLIVPPASDTPPR